MPVGCSAKLRNPSQFLIGDLKIADDIGIETQVFLLDQQFSVVNQGDNWGDVRCSRRTLLSEIASTTLKKEGRTHMFVCL